MLSLAVDLISHVFVSEALLSKVIEVTIEVLQNVNDIK